MAGARAVLEDDPPGSDEYTVVAVANPDTVDRLMRTAVDLAGAIDGGIVAVSVAHKPPSSPFLLFSGERIRERYQRDRTVVLERVVASAGAVDSILLPTVVGPHLDPAADVVEAVARANDASVSVASCVPEHAGEKDRAAAGDDVETAIAAFGGSPASA